MSLSRWLNALIGRPGPQPGIVPEPEAPPFEPASNPELEALVEADPDALDAWLVWADWLQQQGDPRGEIIALAASEDPTARRRADELVARHRGALLGDVAGLRSDMYTVDWHLGHARRLKIAGEYDERALHELLDAFLAAPAGRFVREIALGVCYDGDGVCNYEACLGVLARRKPLLRGLHVGDFQYPDEMEMSWSDAGDLSPLWAALPGLRWLEIQAGQVVLGAIDAPALERFVLRTGGLSRAAMASIATARWPQLAHLEVWFGDPAYGAECDGTDVTPLLSAQGLGNLRHLGLCNAPFADELCRLLVGAPVLRQLRSLDLSKGTLGDEGAARLVAAADRLRHLDRIDVSESWIGDDALAQLQRALPAVVSTRQEGTAPPTERYVQVGE